MNLLEWLKQQGADASLIEKVPSLPKACTCVAAQAFLRGCSLFQIVEEGYALSAIPNNITKEELSHLYQR